MRKMKTYNKLPSPLLELAAWLAVMETAAWIAVEWLWPGVSVDLVMPILELLARSMGQNAASFPLPGVAQMHIALGIASAVAAAALAIDSSRRFHNGVWAGEKPSANGSYGSSRLLSRLPSSSVRSGCAVRESRASPASSSAASGQMATRCWSTTSPMRSCWVAPDQARQPAAFCRRS